MAKSQVVSFSLALTKQRKYHQYWYQTKAYAFYSNIVRSTIALLIVKHVSEKLHSSVVTCVTHIVCQAI